MEEHEPAKKCDICPEECNCAIWNNVGMLTDGFVRYLAVHLEKSMADFRMAIKRIRTGIITNRIKLIIEVISVETKKSHTIDFSFNTTASGHELHSSFLKIFSTTVAPLAQILKNIFLADRIAELSVKLNRKSEIMEALFRLHTNKKHGARVLINLAQAEHFDETGSLKQGALILAYYKGLQELERTEFVDGVTYETLKPESKGYYLKCDLPADKKPTAFYSLDTIDKLGYVSPYTRKHFTDADIIEIVIPTRKEFMELPSVANCVPPLTCIRTASDEAGCRNLTRISMRIQRNYSTPVHYDQVQNEPAQSAPPQFHPFSEEYARD